MSSKRRLHLPPNSCGEAEIEVDGFGVADVQIAVRLRRKARMHAAAVFVGLQIVEDDLADEIGWRRSGRLARLSDSSLLFRSCASSSSMAWSMRFRQVSRPSTSSVSNSGGAFLRPHTATRMGWNIWPALIFSSLGAGAQARRPGPSWVNSAVGQNFARACERRQRHGAIALLRNQLGRIVGRQFVDEEEIGDRGHVAQQS